MIFSSLTFLFVFLPLVVGAYYLFRNRNYRNLVLFTSSILFYAWGEPVYVFLMLASIAINYGMTLYMDKQTQLSRKRLLLVITIGINLLLLGYFKYVGFLIQNINSLFALEIPIKGLSLPIGISFYTFQILSYVIDVYRKNCPAQRNVILLGTYVCLFPQLIAGPIVRYVTVADELLNRHERFDEVMQGLRRFIIGLGKKVLIANQMALLCDTLLDIGVNQIGTLFLWLAALAYTFQIYFDFSGYSDMAIGLGRMFGFHFLENFNYPYIAKSVTDFWRRWHISLSSWFKDYVYIPLGGNRVSKLGWVRNMFIVWMLTGFWHGANWNFILWGAYYGILLVLEKLWLQKCLDKLPVILRWTYTFLIIIIGWMIFRIEDFQTLLMALKTMFVYAHIDPISFIAGHADVVKTLPYLVIAILGASPLIKKVMNYIEHKKLGYVNDAYLFLIWIACIISLVSSSYNPFIYFRF